MVTTSSVHVSRQVQLYRRGSWGMNGMLDENIEI